MAAIAAAATETVTAEITIVVQITEAAADLAAIAAAATETEITVVRDVETENRNLIWILRSTRKLLRPKRQEKTVEIIKITGIRKRTTETEIMKREDKRAETPQSARKL